MKIENRTCHNATTIVLFFPLSISFGYQVPTKTYRKKTLNLSQLNSNMLSKEFIS
ncbi:hypothetical protein GYH30_025123 [Glycine max]|uniref:Uncharacterized protein n=1 Tax=Glycine max TaxID=3847 RepID=K7LE33_SOYBN|nr:hypothetical protein GYH30_025123 [Glycine max]